MANNPVTLTGTLAQNVINSLLNQNTAASTANTTLGGLVANLAAAQSDRSMASLCDQIIRTPNAGAAASIAEKIISDLGITDPTLKQVTLMHDVATLQSVITIQTHTTGVLSNLLSGLGL